VPTFLSPEWLRALDEAAHTLEHQGDADSAIIIEQQVTGTPWGDVTYHAVLGPEAAVVPGSAESPHVVLITDYDTALQLHAGSVNAQHAIASGQMKVRGQIDVLLRHIDMLRAFSDIFRDVREHTDAQPS
jgi:hypothetical protein